jgi:predicted Fe-Mo cluster-binding NifX family protein
LIVDCSDFGIYRKLEVSVEVESMCEKVNALLDLGIDVLLCGAVSRVLYELIVVRGINVVSELRGPVEEVLDAFIHGRSLYPGFTLPGYLPGDYGKGGHLS